MTDKPKEKESWKERLKHTYRLVIMKDESFEEVGAYRMTRLNVYLFMSTVFVATAILVLLFIIFTPMKQLIPGYGDVHLRDNVEELAKKVVELEEKHKANTTYIASVQRLFASDFKTETDVDKRHENMTPPHDSLLNIERIEEEEKLRNAVEKNENLVHTEIKDEEPRDYAKDEAAFVSNKNKPLEQIYLLPPVRGEISNDFRRDNGHLGVDVLAPRNSPIKSIMKGVVIQSGWTLETGKVIAIQHPNNVVSFYKHNSALLKKIGDEVKAGEAVAIIGNTGTLSSGPHLHFEIWYNGAAVDPAEYISFN